MLCVQHFLVCFSSVQSVVSDCLQPHRPQHTRPPCPSPTSGVYPNSCPLSRWCHPTISSSVVPFSSCLQSFPAPGSFPVSQFYASGGQNIGVPISTSVLPMNTQDWSPLGCTSVFIESYLWPRIGILFCLKNPRPKLFWTWNMLQGRWWAGLELIGLGSFKDHLGSACPAGRRALQHSFAGLDFSVFTGRCQPCMAVCVQGRRPLSFIRQKDGLHSTCGAGGTQCQTRCHIDLLQKFPREGTVYVAHSQRFLLYPSPLGHQSCPPRAVQCPNTVWPLQFSLASAVCFYIFVYLLNFWLCWVFVVTQAFSLVVVPGLLFAGASLVEHGL